MISKFIKSIFQPELPGFSVDPKPSVPDVASATATQPKGVKPEQPVELGNYMVTNTHDVVLRATDGTLLYHLSYKSACEIAKQYAVEHKMVVKPQPIPEQK